MSQVVAPMVGKVIQVLVKVGDRVEENQEVIMLEAMKMEMPIVAEEGGKVTEVKVKEGQSVEADQVLVVLS
ncbi:MAG: biotin/lipoyl-containing protein [Polyangia bacterium]|jgi:biotin carboxyl carrier protein|nr:biotin/lipoyl-containing protein [Polyangia bacterium]